MNKIIVPVDFSPSSQNALVYASRLAYRFSSELLAVHAYLPTKSEPFAAHQMQQALIHQEEEVGLSYFVKAQEVLPEYLRNTLSMRFELNLGIASEEILEQCENEQPDLVVMGMRGGSESHKKLLGSTARAVVQRSKVPVLLVPEETGFKEFKNIYYATDYAEEDLSILDNLLGFAGEFGAELNCLHIKSHTNSFTNFKTGILKTVYKNDICQGKLKLESLGYDNVLEGIFDFTKYREVDLLVMLKHQKSLLGQYLNRVHPKPEDTAMSIPMATTPLLILPVDKGANPSTYFSWELAA